MVENEPHEARGASTKGWADRLGRVGVDWWANAVVGVIVLLALADALPKIPW